MWMEAQIQRADFALLVCTETYLGRVERRDEPGKGRGVLWEAKLIYNLLYGEESVIQKFIPVLFAGSQTASIPLPLRQIAHYQVDTDTGYEDLYRHLTGQPRYEVPVIGKRRALRAQTPASFVASPAATQTNVLANVRRKLRVFLCHASSDKAAVRKLYELLQQDGFQPWLDEEDLIPGQKWEEHIPKAVHEADIVLVCLSPRSINKQGYVQKEITFALDVAGEKPEDTIFIIPLRLEECDVPRRLSAWHWVDLFRSNGYDKLRAALQSRALQLGERTASTESPTSSPWLLRHAEPITQPPTTPVAPHRILKGVAILSACTLALTLIYSMVHRSTPDLAPETFRAKRLFHNVLLTIIIIVVIVPMRLVATMGIASQERL